MSSAKPKRNKEIHRLRKAGHTFSAIGNYYGISKQRVWIIVNNLPHQNGKLRRLKNKVRELVTRLFHTDISIGG